MLSKILYFKISQSTQGSIKRRDMKMKYYGNRMVLENINTYFIKKHIN